MQRRRRRPDAEHACPQALAERQALVVAHDHELEVDRLDSGHSRRSPVDFVGQLLEAGPGGHRQRHFYGGPASARPHRAEEAELPERQVQLGLHDGVQRRLELRLVCCHAFPRLRWAPVGGAPAGDAPSRVTPAGGGNPLGRLPSMSTAPITVEPEHPGGADDGQFSAAVAAVAAAFGDPTRRDIFLHVRAAPGVTVNEVATRFSLHPNVARHHLQRLVGGGYLRVETGRNHLGRRPAFQALLLRRGGAHSRPHATTRRPPHASARRGHAPTGSRGGGADGVALSARSTGARSPRA